MDSVIFNIFFMAAIMAAAIIAQFVIRGTIDWSFTFLLTAAFGAVRLLMIDRARDGPGRGGDRL
ncbi:MAG: hypothetical protein AB1815_01365 [Bacillota bacterium]